MDPKNTAKAKEANIGGPMLLLSVWSWERLPVGRPTPAGLGYEPWDDHDDPDHMPTWAYKWDKVEGFVGNSKTMYLHYYNELWWILVHLFGLVFPGHQVGCFFNILLKIDIQLLECILYY